MLASLPSIRITNHLARPMEPLWIVLAKRLLESLLEHAAQVPQNARLRLVVDAQVLVVAEAREELEENQGLI